MTLSPSFFHFHNGIISYITKHTYIQSTSSNHINITSKLKKKKKKIYFHLLKLYKIYLKTNLTIYHSQHNLKMIKTHKTGLSFIWPNVESPMVSITTEPSLIGPRPAFEALKSNTNTIVPRHIHRPNSVGSFFKTQQKSLSSLYSFIIHREKEREARRSQSWGQGF